MPAQLVSSPPPLDVVAQGAAAVNEWYQGHTVLANVSPGQAIRDQQGNIYGVPQNKSGDLSVRKVVELGDISNQVHTETRINYTAAAPPSDINTGQSIDTSRLPNVFQPKPVIPNIPPEYVRPSISPPIKQVIPGYVSPAPINQPSAVGGGVPTTPPSTSPSQTPLQQAAVSQGLIRQQPLEQVPITAPKPPPMNTMEGTLVSSNEEIQKMFGYTQIGRQTGQYGYTQTNTLIYQDEAGKEINRTTSTSFVPQPKKFLDAEGNVILRPNYDIPVYKFGITGYDPYATGKNIDAEQRAVFGGDIVKALALPEISPKPAAARFNIPKTSYEYTGASPLDVVPFSRSVPQIATGLKYGANEVTPLIPGMTGFQLAQRGFGTATIEAATFAIPGLGVTGAKAVAGKLGYEFITSVEGISLATKGTSANAREMFPVLKTVLEDPIVKIRQNYFSFTGRNIGEEYVGSGYGRYVVDVETATKENLGRVVSKLKYEAKATTEADKVFLDINKQGSEIKIKDVLAPQKEANVVDVGGKKFVTSGTYTTEGYVGRTNLVLTEPEANTITFEGFSKDIIVRRPAPLGSAQQTLLGSKQGLLTKLDETNIAGKIVTNPEATQFTFTEFSPYGYKEGVDFLGSANRIELMQRAAESPQATGIRANLRTPLDRDLYDLARANKIEPIYGLGEREGIGGVPGKVTEFGDVVSINRVGQGGEQVTSRFTTPYKQTYVVGNEGAAQREILSLQNFKISTYENPKPFAPVTNYLKYDQRMAYLKELGESTNAPRPKFAMTDKEWIDSIRKFGKMYEPKNTPGAATSETPSVSMIDKTTQEALVRRVQAGMKAESANDLTRLTERAYREGKAILEARADTYPTGRAFTGYGKNPLTVTSRLRPTVSAPIETLGATSFDRYIKLMEQNSNKLNKLEGETRYSGLGTTENGNTAMYNRFEGAGQNPLFERRSVFSTNVVKLRTSNALKLIGIEKNTNERSEQDTSSFIIQRQNLGQGLDLGTDTETLLRQQQRQEQQQAQQQAIQTKTIQIIDIKQPKIIDIYGSDGGIFSEPPTLPQNKNRKKGKSGYAVWVKRFGKFKMIGSGYSHQAALDVGAEKVSKTLAATFKITPTSEEANRINPFPGRFEGMRQTLRSPMKPQLDTFVQKSWSRLSTGQEVGEIQYFKKARRKL